MFLKVWFTTRTVSTMHKLSIGNNFTPTFRIADVLNISSRSILVCLEERACLVHGGVSVGKHTR